MEQQKYKIKLISELNPEWFGVVVEQSLETCRHNNDRTKVVLKLPNGINSIDDVPDEWRSDYEANLPYLTHTEIKEILKGDEWNPPEPI